MKPLFRCIAELFQSPLKFITHDTVAKAAQDREEFEPFTYPSEAVALDVVSKHTSIPVPRVRRVVELECGTVLIVMDFIRGPQLSTVWPTMTHIQKDYVANTLKGYVRQLRAPPTPRTCDGLPVFGQVIDTRGPFGTYADLTAFFNSRRQKMMKRYPDVSNTIPPFDDSYPLVTKKTLVLVDWAWAGFYPEWWESVAMKAQAENEERVQGRKDPLWDEIIYHVCGEYRNMEEWLDSVGPSLCWS
ncbi:hypothetical protein K438DRAFT_1904274 [Mycena galopus ATCC 62051]|nr:hypothetical protein K438DRAFT_1904274 [Mycena galopus ATCC 62051]